MPSSAPRTAVDLALRSVWKHRPEALARLALGGRIRAIERKDPRVLTAQREADALATVLTDDGPCTLHLEFETRAKSRALPRRMAHAAWLLHGPVNEPPVRGVAILVDARPDLPDHYEMRHGDDVVGTYRYRVVTLSELDPDVLLDAPEDLAGLLALVPLSRGATEAHVRAAARRLRALAAPDAPELCLAAYLLGSRRFGYADLLGMFDEEYLMTADGWAYIQKKGFTDGFERGDASGFEKGRRATLSRVCSVRFGDRLEEVIAGLPTDALEEATDVIAAASDANAARERLLSLRR